MIYLQSITSSESFIDYLSLDLNPYLLRKLQTRTEEVITSEGEGGGKMTGT